MRPAPRPAAATNLPTVTELASLTTLRVGGPADCYRRVTTTEELVEAVSAADEAGEPVLLVAGGSNLLVDDAGPCATVVHVAGRGVRVDSVHDCAGVSVTVAAGHPFDELVERCVAEGWVGLEALSGIPGSTGATPVQNVGAYGQEVAQTIASVRTWDRRDRRVRTLAMADCGFAYRTSRFKADPSRFLVLEVTFQLRQGDLAAPVAYAELATRLGVDVGTRVPLADVRSAVLGLRRGKGMVLDEADHDTWSAGSFFTNPVLDDAARLPDGAPRFAAGDGRVKTSAAWLIEHAGFTRGYGLPGPAALSTKHTLAVTNRGTATAADLLALARQVRDGVRAATGITLVNEPTLVGCRL